MDNLCTSRCGNALYLWSEWLVILIDLNNVFRNIMPTQTCRGRYLRIGEDCRQWRGHNNFQSSENRPPGYLLFIPSGEGYMLYVCEGLHLKLFIYERRGRWLPTPWWCDLSVYLQFLYFKVMFTCNTLATDGEGHITFCVIKFISGQNVSKDSIAFAYIQRLSYQRAHKMKVMTFGSVISSWSISESRDTDSSSSEYDNMETDNCQNTSSNFELRCFVLTDYLSNETMYNDCYFGYCLNSLSKC